MLKRFELLGGILCYLSLFPRAVEEKYACSAGLTQALLKLRGRFQSDPSVSLYYQRWLR